MTIPAIDKAIEQEAIARQGILTKPPGALGRLETLSIRLAGMTGRLDWLPERRAAMVFAGDHGVAAQGVSAFPQEVTAQMVLNFLAGGAAINVLARQMGARVTVVNAGVLSDLPDQENLVNEPVARGTADFTQGPAMTAEQATAAVELGRSTVKQAIEKGLDVLAVGEMGIGNTTPASAIIAVLTGKPVAEVTGRGTGIADEALQNKIAVIEQGLQVNGLSSDNLPTGMDVLAKIGGYEIGAMAGAMIGAAENRVPVIVDGLISTAAALVAAELAPGVEQYFLAGHHSVEPGHIYALEKLGITPLVDLGLRLGEGTGAVLAMPILEAAMRTLNEMATFADAGVSNKDD
ncbi:nicotinate-nucleotide--dimethylbenzimidazole phosphoribosyltransferase [Chloroflexota bacterium]